MAEKTAQQQVQEQFKVAESYYNNAFRTMNDLMSATTEYSFDVAEKSMRFATDLNGQYERNVKDAMTTYRAVYQENFKAWQGYVQGLTDLMTRVGR